MFQYRLKDPPMVRRRALAYYVVFESEYRNTRMAAISKKAHLNQIRIYKRYKFPEQCKLITSDMRWLDKTFINDGVTNPIC